MAEAGGGLRDLLRRWRLSASGRKGGFWGRILGGRLAKQAPEQEQKDH
jgi:hypothetical protein